MENNLISTCVYQGEKSQFMVKINCLKFNMKSYFIYEALGTLKYLIFLIVVH